MITEITSAEGSERSRFFVSACRKEFRSFPPISKPSQKVLATKLRQETALKRALCARARFDSMRACAVGVSGSEIFLAQNRRAIGGLDDLHTPAPPKRLHSARPAAPCGSYDDYENRPVCWDNWRFSPANGLTRRAARQKQRFLGDRQMRRLSL